MASEHATVSEPTERAGRPLLRGNDAVLTPLLTIEQVAEHLSVSVKSVRRLVGQRELPCVRIGRRIRFQVGDVSRFVAARRER